jgi:hypothetical protein
VRILRFAERVDDQHASLAAPVVEKLNMNLATGLCAALGMCMACCEGAGDACDSSKADESSLSSTGAMPEASDWQKRAVGMVLIQSASG